MVPFGLLGLNKDRWQLNLKEMEKNKIVDRIDKWTRPTYVTPSPRPTPRLRTCLPSQISVWHLCLPHPLQGTQGGGVVSRDSC